jgi:bacterioferritin (cytochrome b1)
MEKLTQKNREKVIDLLTERLEFERSGVKLYDRIIGRIQRAGDQEALKMLDAMRKHRDQEKEHEEWLESQIRALGGDAHGQTELSRLSKRESQGIEQVVMEGSSPLPHLFHALLAAELVDHAGWELLVQLADEAGDREARHHFQRCLHEEVEHLAFVRRALEQFARREVLGQQVSLPHTP